MYLHLGQDTVVRTDEIIGIFDLENTSISKITKNFLAKSEKSGQVINVSCELPKSFVICGKGKKSVVYITQISSTTLKKRAGFIDGISNIDR
ncbi:extracellular matrix/biofilm biosynthesis regulator RemA family protein [Oscillospiraceae bacterium PP1C4]